MSDWNRYPLELIIQPYYYDHRVEQNAVLPCVESMQLLSSAVKNAFPNAVVHLLKDVKFPKFLYLPSNVSGVELFHEVSVTFDTSIASKLISISKIGAITRIKEHACIHFNQNSLHPDRDWNRNIQFPLIDNWLEISPDQIYHELVPFGPAYQNIIQLHISELGAIAHVKSNNLESGPLPLGSAFPLDASFHAACVWGQRFCGFVGFPIGFHKRHIISPTQPGQSYISTIIPVQKHQQNWFSVNIYIYDHDRVLYEEVIGVQMKDISAGRVKPR